ncbi:MAG: M48 family metalloprotease [Croceibacterium sp.]
MTRLFRSFVSLFAWTALLGFIAQPVAAQAVLRDAETEALLQDMMDPLTQAAGLPKGAVQVVLLQDNSINAFVANGQKIYILSGLINTAASANEVQGVLAHELGHIIGGHAISVYQGAGKAGKIQLLSLLVGVAAALAGAPADAAMGAIALGQQAALGSFLQFSRTQESSADAASVSFLSKAGITGRGSIAFFEKLQNFEFRYGVSQSEEAGFASTHPLVGDRISRLEADFKNDAAWDTPPDPQLQARFERVKAKLYGYVAEPAQTLNAYPAYLTSVPARYARAYAYHKQSKMTEALAEVDALLATAPNDPYFLEMKGQVLLESGRPTDALAPLRTATELSGNAPLIASTFGLALLATEDSGNLDEAEQVLKTAVGRDRENPMAWYQLGLVYGERGDIPRAQLASAEQQIMSDQPREALQNAEAAERSLPTGTPDWIRAQDVALQARAELERSRDRN